MLSQLRHAGNDRPWPHIAQGKKAALEDLGCLHSCIIHLIELKEGNKTISLLVLCLHTIFDGALVAGN